MTTQFCSGLQSYGRLCTNSENCALYRCWWDGYDTAFRICTYGKHDRFVPIKLEAAAPQPIQSLPIGKTMELFA